MRLDRNTGNLLEVDLVNAEVIQAIKKKAGRRWGSKSLFLRYQQTKCDC